MKYTCKNYQILIIYLFTLTSSIFLNIFEGGLYWHYWIGKANKFMLNIII